MKATDLLKKQHKDVKALFRSFEDAEESEKAVIFEALASSLVAHDAIEREIFYPACEEKMGMTDLLGESLVEHGVVEFCLYRANENQGEDAFDFHLTVLEEVVDHHVKEEESGFFPRVEKAFSAEALEKIGQAMEARFEEALAEDFREPLVENLKQVLDGATKTEPAAPKPPPRKKAAGKTAPRGRANGVRAH